MVLKVGFVLNFNKMKNSILLICLTLSSLFLFSQNSDSNDLNIKYDVSEIHEHVIETNKNIYELVTEFVIYKPSKRIDEYLIDNGLDKIYVENFLTVFLEKDQSFLKEISGKNMRAPKMTGVKVMKMMNVFAMS